MMPTRTKKLSKKMPGIQLLLEKKLDFAVKQYPAKTIAVSDSEKLVKFKPQGTWKEPSNLVPTSLKILDVEHKLQK